MAAPDVKVGSMVLEFNAETQQLENSIQISQEQLNRFAKTMEDVSNYTNSWTVAAQKISIISVGLKNLYGVLKGFLQGSISQFTQFGDQLDKMSQRTGVAASDLSRLKFAAEQCGGSIDSLGDGLKEMNNKLQAAQMGNTGEIGKFGNLDLDVNALGKMNVRERLMTIADAFRRCQNETEKTRFALELFGDAGYKLLPMLQLGREGIEELMDEADRLGISISNEDIANAAKMTDEINRLSEAFNSIVRNFMAGASETFMAWMEDIREWVQWISRWVKENQAFVNALVRIVTPVAMAGGAIAAFMATLAIVPPLGLAVAGVVAVLAGGFAALNTSLDRSTQSVTKFLEEERKLAEETKKQRKSQDELRQMDDLRIQRLGYLAKQKKLSNEQEKEALRLIQQLKKHYPKAAGLLRFDFGTGEIINFEKTSNRMKAAMQENAAAMTQKRIKELEGLHDLFIQSGKPYKEFKDDPEFLAIRKELKEERLRLARIRRGYMEAIVGGRQLYDEKSAEEKEKYLEEFANQVKEFEKLQESLPKIESYFDEKSPLEKHLETIDKTQDGYIQLCQRIKEYALSLKALADNEVTEEKYQKIADEYDQKIANAHKQQKQDRQKALELENKKLDKEIQAEEETEEVRDSRKKYYQALKSGTSRKAILKAKDELESAEQYAKEISAAETEKKKVQAEKAEKKAKKEYEEKEKTLGKDHQETVEAKQAYATAMQNRRIADKNFYNAMELAYSHNLEEIEVADETPIENRFAQNTYTTMNAYAAMYGSGESEARRQTRIWERIEVAINELVGEQKGGI